VREEDDLRSSATAPSRLIEVVPQILLAVAMTVSAVLIFGLVSDLSFIADDWELLVVRQGWGLDTFFEPFNENIVVGPAFVFKALLAIFGMSSAMPFYVVSIGLFLLSSVLLFALLRRRVGDWPALVGAVLVLFLGAAFEDLLWAFQIGYFGSMAAGLAMLLMLEREDERSDYAACALLAVSVAFSSLGLVFVAGALVDVAFGRRPRLHRADVIFWPLFLFAIWWAGWGHEAKSHLSADNVVHLPSYVYDAAAAGVTSLLGLATNDGSGGDQPHLIWGKIVFALLAIGVGFRILRDREVSRGMAIFLTLAFAFWILAGLNRNEARAPTSSRYQYPSAVFLLLIAGQALKGIRIPAGAVPVAGVAAILAAIGGMSLMTREQEDRWVPAANSLRASLAAVELSAPSTAPAFTVEVPPTITFPASRYLAATSEYGSPAFTEEQLAERPATERATADLTMAQAMSMSLISPAGSFDECRRLSASIEADVRTALPSGEYLIENESASPVEVLLRRFAHEFPVTLGPIEPGASAALPIPQDQTSRDWRLGLGGSGPVRLCSRT
jgi:hypothetical protein